MITQKQESNKELCTGQETTPSPKIATDITDKELDALVQELVREYGDFMGNSYGAD